MNSHTMVGLSSEIRTVPEDAGVSCARSNEHQLIFASGVVLKMSSPVLSTPGGYPVCQAGSVEEVCHWPIELDISDRYGEFLSLPAFSSAVHMLRMDHELLDRLREQMRGEITSIARLDGKFGILFEVNFSSIESDGGAVIPELAVPKWAELRPHHEVVAQLMDGLATLSKSYPQVRFGVPDRRLTYRNRPVAWAFVADGTLSADQLDDLEQAMLKL